MSARCRLWVALLLLLAPIPLPTRAAPNCTLQLGFASLAEQLGPRVGACVEPAQYDADGDAHQRTTTGAFLWRKADNWTAFTDGWQTWAAGPGGVAPVENAARLDPTASPFAVDLDHAAPAAVPGALQTLGVQWFDGKAAGDLAHAATSIQRVNYHDLGAVAAAARQYPGRIWQIGIEPNGAEANKPEMQPAAYAVILHDVATTLKAADPTALLLGPAVVDWSSGCVGCAGMPTGSDWTTAMRSAYVAAYDADLPYDIWAIHTYPLDWQHLPAVDYTAMEQQLIDLRAYLDASPTLRGKPIWITELGVVWGYTAYQLPVIRGKATLLPAGALRQDLVEDYLRAFLDWLLENGPRYGITRWFVWSVYNPDAPGDHAGAISLLDGPGPDARLTAFGAIFMAAEAKGAQMAVSAGSP